jgi:hypothetical protein
LTGLASPPATQNPSIMHALGERSHCCVASVHTWQDSAHGDDGPPVHTPPMQLSPTVQYFPSLHHVPSNTGCSTQSPVAGWHCAFMQVVSPLVLQVTTLVGS